ncbi:MAG: hypothetical protein KAT68_03165 [Bacteroidales bacterium]|nr:hypothetical protein [Bacteroidales bacterium]
MKNIVFILIIALFFGNSGVYAQSDELVNVCALNIGNATYLKDFKVKLQQSNVKPSPSVKFSVVLNKGTIYKINVCEAEGYEGKAVIKLYDGGSMLGTNKRADGSLLSAIGAQINKTGVYQIAISFKDGKEGAAVAILSFMNVN